jgi:hypothetical protein
MAVDVSTRPTFQAATPQRLFSAGAITNDALLFQYDVAKGRWALELGRSKHSGGNAPCSLPLFRP